MFVHLSVCVILFTGGVSVKGGLCPGGLCQGEPPPTVTCGKNASYWNAFLFSLLNVKETSKSHRNGRFTQAVATMNTIAGRRVYSNHKHMG